MTDELPPIACPCGIGDLRVYRVTRKPGEIVRERRCPNGHRVKTVERFSVLIRRISIKLLPVAKPET